MRAIKAALLLALVGLIGWALVNQGQAMLAVWPDYRLATLGAVVACIYVLGDLADRSREWFGWRSAGPRRRSYPWRRYE